MRRLPRPAAVPLAVRIIVVLAGVVLAVIPERITTAGVATVLVGVAAGLAAPRVVGSTLGSAVFVLVWVVAAGWQGTPSVGRTVAAAAALYVLHSGMALAACLPLETEVSRGVLARWVGRSAVPVALAALVLVVDEALPRQEGAVALEVLGLVGVALLAVGIGLAVLRRDPPRIE